MKDSLLPNRPSPGDVERCPKGAHPQMRWHRLCVQGE
jgi:hypothetical protein